MAQTPQLGDPADKAEAVVLSDTVDMVNLSRRLYIGRARIDPAHLAYDHADHMIGAGAYGQIRVVHKSGEEMTYEIPHDGFILPVRVVRVMETGTTAGLIVNWY